MSSSSSENKSSDRTSRGGGEEQEERTDLWMTTYSDMVTLLLTFFVLMFAISNADPVKLALMGEGMKGNLDLVKMGEIFDKLGVGDNNEQPPDDIEPDVIVPPVDEPTPSEPDTPNAPSPELVDMYNKMQSFIEQMGLGDSMKLLYNGDYLLITLANDVWFATGSADISPVMMDYAAVIANLLAETQSDENPFEVVVVGHTDNVPINTVRYPSNWYVSVDRAVNFLSILVQESGLDPNLFSARGCGEERPIATNDTPDGRQLNRRVEVLITILREEAATILTDIWESAEEAIGEG